MAPTIHSSGSGPDPRVAEHLSALVEVEQKRNRWYWRVVGVIVAVAAIASATFAALAYFTA